MAKAVGAGKLDNFKVPQAMREKYWSEITDSEKIERARDIIKNLLFEVRSLTRKVDKLSRHQHDSSGDIVVKFSDGQYFGGDGAEVSPIRTLGGQKNHDVFF